MLRITLFLEPKDVNLVTIGYSSLYINNNLLTFVSPPIRIKWEISIFTQRTRINCCVLRENEEQVLILIAFLNRYLAYYLINKNFHNDDRMKETLYKYFNKVNSEPIS